VSYIFAFQTEVSPREAYRRETILRLKELAEFHYPSSPKLQDGARALRNNLSHLARVVIGQGKTEVDISPEISDPLSKAIIDDMAKKEQQQEKKEIETGNKHSSHSKAGYREIEMLKAVLHCPPR
jgi:hypothetical protein